MSCATTSLIFILLEECFWSECLPQYSCTMRNHLLWGFQLCSLGFDCFCYGGFYRHLSSQGSQYRTQRSCWARCYYEGWLCTFCLHHIVCLVWSGWAAAAQWLALYFFLFSSFQQFQFLLIRNHRPRWPDQRYWCKVPDPQYSELIPAWLLFLFLWQYCGRAPWRLLSDR